MRCASRLSQPSRSNACARSCSPRWPSATRIPATWPIWLLMKYLFPNHPYGRPEDGYPETIQRITREDLIDFHQQLLWADNAGDGDRWRGRSQQAIDQVQAVLGDWANPDRQPPFIYSLQLPTWAKPSAGILPLPGKYPDRPGAGDHGPKRISPDYMAASLGNSILGAVWHDGAHWRCGARKSRPGVPCQHQPERLDRWRLLGSFGRGKPGQPAARHRPDPERAAPLYPGTGDTRKSCKTARRILSAGCRFRSNRMPGLPTRCSMWSASSLGWIITSAIRPGAVGHPRNDPGNCPALLAS